MAQSVKIIAKFALVVCLFFLVQVHVDAQQISDPTKPPASILQTDGGIEIPAGPVLQSILISPRRKIAIIDGQAVSLNGKFGNQTLIRMSESEVVLKNGKQLQTLSLHPDLIKKKARGTNKLN